MKKLALYLLLFICSFAARAQDLNARVQVLTAKIPTTNKRVFQALGERDERFFKRPQMGRRPDIAPPERIDCSFTFNITQWDGSSAFSADLQVQSSRPIFNSSYTTTLLNVNDKDFDFTYTEGQTLDYTDQTFQSNLTAVMAFYAYIIVGMDYDSFGKYSGTPYLPPRKILLPTRNQLHLKGGKLLTVT
jgi:hypothetical protein